jgi:hypothetical protein
MGGIVWEKYDREELYQKVWEQPLVKVAEEYGVSAVALGKTSHKLSVPVPGRGHWAKLAHGKEGTSKPPLPKLEAAIHTASATVPKPAQRIQEQMMASLVFTVILLSEALPLFPTCVEHRWCAIVPSARHPALQRTCTKPCSAWQRKRKHCAG